MGDTIQIGDLRDALVPNVAASAPSAVSVGVAAVRLDTGLAGRRAILVVNNGTATVFLGVGASASTVTTANGIPVAPSGGSAQLNVGPNLPVYAISGTAGQDVRVLEVA